MWKAEGVEQGFGVWRQDKYSERASRHGSMVVSYNTGDCKHSLRLEYRI